MREATRRVSRGTELLAWVSCLACSPAPHASEPTRVKPDVVSASPARSSVETLVASPPASASAASTSAPLDSDRDGIVDSEDRCPTEPGARSADRARWGCPHKLPFQDDGLMLSFLPFKPGSTKLDVSQSVPLLNAVAARLKEHADYCLLLVGYADAKTDPVPLASLRLKRARAAQKYLIERGVKAERLAVEGADDPCTTEPLNHDGRRVSLRALRCPITSPLPQLECRHKNSYVSQQWGEEPAPESSHAR